MKKSLYYYSEKKLKYIEIKKFYSKFILLVVLFSGIFATIFLGSYIFISDVLHPHSDLVKLRNENADLREKFISMSSKLSRFNNELNYLNSKENALRISVNLDPLEQEENNFGIGGASFKEITPSSVSDIAELVEDVDNSINNLNSKLVVTTDNYHEIEKTLDNNLELFKSLPALLPAQGPIGDRFGMRMHPILKMRRMHTGLDIVVNTGAKVYAPGDGKVIKVGNRGGYGRTIEIDHGFGYTSLYAHLSKIKVKKGQMVKRGEIIGLSGRSGTLATGPHLHYEVKHNGIHLNPRNFIFGDIKVFDLLATKAN